MKSRIWVLLSIISMVSTLPQSHAQWVQQNSGISATLVDVVMLDTAQAIAAGRNGSILRTTNSGATWIDVTAHLSFIQPWSGLSFFDSAHGIVVGDHGVVMTTTNGGIGWMRHQIPGGKKCLSALQVGPADIYVGTDSGWVYSTSDTGRTWNPEKVSTRPIRALFKYRGPEIFGVSKYALTPYSLCMEYVIPTHAWSEVILPYFRGLGSEAFSAEFCNGGGAGFIVGVQGDLRSAPAILRKSMSDTAWRQVSPGIPRDGALLGVSAPSAKVICVCGSDGCVFRSTDGGDTWADTHVPATRNINAIYFIDENRGFAVGDSGLILYTSNGGLTGVGDRSCTLPTGFELRQNYPNPFNPTTVLSYQLSVASEVNLVVYDILGREVSVLVNERMDAGVHEIRFDASNLSSGVYFYRIQARHTDDGRAGEFTQTRSLVLIR